MSVSLVLGANGQDGSYLVEHLVASGEHVIGTDLQSEPGPYAPHGDYAYRSLDLCRPGILAALLEEIKPDKVFHLSAVHGAAGFAYEPVWRRAAEVNILSVHELLEWARLSSRKPVIMYASSSKVFGESPEGILNEDSPKRMTCLYSISKLAAEGLIGHYRLKHGIKAGCIYFFNHESPRRPAGFFFQKIARELHHCLMDPTYVFEVNTLDFYCDWGAAAEYMELINALAKAAPGEDFVMASGKTWLGREFVDALWKRFGLEVTKHVREKSPASAMPRYYQADIGKMRRAIGRSPQRDALDLCGEMVRAQG